MDHHTDHVVILLIRSFCFYIGYFLATVIHAPICLLVAPFLSFVERHNFINLWSRFIIWWLKVTCGVTYNVKGRENLKKINGAIIVSKHQSQWETFFLQLLFNPQVTVLKRELIWLPLFGWALSLLRPIVINRADKRGAMKQIIVQGRKRLAEGCSILIFPEGTRIGPGEDSGFSKGAFILAKETGYPIIPVAHNSGECWRPHHFIKLPGHITLEIGDPIPTTDETLESLMTKTRDWMQSRMHRISQIEACRHATISLPSH